MILKLFPQLCCAIYILIIGGIFTKDKPYHESKHNIS